MAAHRHKRDTNARLVVTRALTKGRETLRSTRRTALVAVPIATLATVGVVTTGVVAADRPEIAQLVAGPTAVADPTRAAAALPAAAPKIKREVVISRSTSRRDEAKAAARREALATERAVEAADTWRWATTDLNLWPTSGETKNQVGLLESGKKILITGRTADGRDEIVVRGVSRWVTSGYLADARPVETIPGVGGACTNGTSVSGVSNFIVAVHRAVCANFPEINVYGTLRGGGGDHPLGKAVDIMVSGDRGWQVAEFVRAHASELGVSYVIYAQRIWSVERAGEGWRPMEDRGSATANHYDHVHVSVF